MLRLLQRYGWVLAAPIEDFSVAYLEISAIGGMPGWPMDSAGQRVLVERRSWFDDQQVAALRSAGKDIRQCTGPLHRVGRTCPLVTSGRCRLAEGADVIVSLLPAGEPDCAAVLAAHRRLWPHRLAEQLCALPSARPVLHHAPGGPWRMRRSARRSSSLVPPHTPASWPLASAHSRQGVRTVHPAHICLARAT
jgi:hypothetical protein